MKFTARLMDIDKNGVLMHRSDARTVGVLEGDRVRLLNVVLGESATAIVDTTTTMLEKGCVGIFHRTNVRLQLKDGVAVEVREAERLASLDMIRKKLDGARLSKDEVMAIVKDTVDDNLSSMEMATYIAASYIHGMDMDEVEHLTRAMVATGERIQFVTHPIVDKHSIGGVPGNKITLIVVPVIAAAGLRIPKTSSRAITGAGGTADLMEVLAPVEFSAAEVKRMTEKVGGVIVWGGATNIAPADDRFIMVEYPFRIDARGQMLASVMAKKFAVGADVVVIDIPVGKHTKVIDVQEGRKLARQFMELGERLGIRVECALTYGESLVGHAIGPNLEVQEALQVLEGAGKPTSLLQKSLAIAGIALEMSGKAAQGQGYAVAEEILKSGKALEKLRQIIEIQGGNPRITSAEVHPGPHRFVVNAPISGYVVDLNNRALITIARAAGAPHDRGAGIYIHAKKGSRVNQGEPIFTIYADRSWRLQNAVEVGRQLMPVLVEGMLLDRVPSTQWV
ncbi:MAG: AMP phosphorylase [Methanomicrobiales archaeon]|nr:AMP phosphorylase [Methanomicrobiales archaeon]